MTDVAIYQPGELAASTAMERAADYGTWAPKLQSAAATAREICQTDFVPAALRGKPAAVTAAILAGSEMGLGPMTSLMHIHMIDGRPSLSAEMQRGLVLGLGHHLRYREMTTTRCIVDGQRHGEAEWTTVTWTIDDAKRAGLDGKTNWRKYPRRMLAARATGELCRMLFADALAGMPYSAEELEDEADDTAAATDQPAEPKPAQRTARRRQASRPSVLTGPEDPTFAPPAAASAPTGAPAPSQPAPSDDLPPLPGEDEPAEREPAPASSGQVGIMQSHFKRLGFTDDERDQRLAAAATVAGLPEGTELGSLNLLTQDQAKAVIDTLSRCKDRDRLIALLVAGEVTDE
jgi:hypothetical protein